MGNKDSELVKRKEVLNDFAEILNNINDDLEKDIDKDGYKNYKEVVKSIEKYTLKVIIRKYKKYGGKIVKD